MAKMHTRLKRKLGLKCTSKKHRFVFMTVERKKGAKSFSSKESAEAWKGDKKGLVLHETPSGKFQWRVPAKG